MITCSKFELLLSSPRGFEIVGSRDSATKIVCKAAVKAIAIVAIVSAPDATGAPNLTPYQAPGWSDKIVVSRTFGTTTDSTSLTTLDPLYVDWAVINNGDLPVGGFYTSLYVDNIFLNSWFFPSLNVGFYNFNTDYFIGSLSAGTHTVTIWADSTSLIGESNEGDNVYTKTITVNQPSQPNLTPHQPPGWSDKIVVSTTTNTTTDSGLLTAADSIFLDWAIINNGTAATAAPFLASLYIDGFFRTSWNNNPPVNTNTWQLILDYPLGPLAPGTHTLTIVADPGFAIAESNESDNSYTKTINIVAFPEIRIAPTNLSFDASSRNPPIFVEIDWMEDGTHSHRPSQAVLDCIVQAFALEGFDIHLELSEAIPHQNVLLTTNNPSSSPSVQAIRDEFFDHINDSRYYYSIWGHLYSDNGGPTGSSGIADLPGRINLVTLGNFAGQVGTTKEQVGTFIHEFGHNLGQRHGGIDSDNYKPNYISVMNYHYQFPGVGPGLVGLGLANSGAGINNFGYSHGTLSDLDENNLNENLGIGLGRAVDWNCDGDATDVNVIKDLNSENWCSSFGSRSVISDFDNWSDIVGNIRTTASAARKESSVRSERCMGWEEYQELLKQHARIQAALGSRTGGDPASQGESNGTGDGNCAKGGRLNHSTTFAIFNDGAATLTVSSLALDAPAPWVTWWPPAPFDVQPGQSRKVSVYVNYDLAPAGQTTRRLLVQSNDADESPYPNGVFVQTTATSGGVPQLSGMSVSNGVVRFSVNGPVGSNCVVQVSSDLVIWSPLSTNTIPSGGSLPVTDNIGLDQSGRFYRAVIR